MIRLGAMIASWLGSRLGLPPHRLKILVGCGAAAGLAAAYNIPIGGALFAMEVILGNFALEIFGPIVVSSVISTLIARALAGNVPIYAAPGLRAGERLGDPGLRRARAGRRARLGGLHLGVRGGRSLFARLHLAAGAAAAARWAWRCSAPSGSGVPHVLGGGSEHHQPGAGRRAGPAAAARCRRHAPAPRPRRSPSSLATALTAGSGGSGGLFTPSLFFGALVGGAYGYWVHSLWPALASPYGAYAAVGMAAVAAGTSHAPISAILILFEFTGNYDLILPLMVASILVEPARRASCTAASIYTESLRRRGVDLPWRMEEAVLAGLKAEDLARADPDILRPGDPYGDVVEKFLATRRQRLFVVGEDGRLLGAISLHDIKHALDEPEHLTAVVAHDLMVPVREVDPAATSACTAPPRSSRTATSSGCRWSTPTAGSWACSPSATCWRSTPRRCWAGRRCSPPSSPAGTRRRAATTSSCRPTSRCGWCRCRRSWSARPWPRRACRRRSARASSRSSARRRGGEERVIPDAQTVLARGDELVLLGPTAALEAMKAS